MRQRLLIKKIILTTLLLLCITMPVYADFNIENAGYTIDDPYSKKSSIKPSISADYYDCAVPYKNTLKDIGGYLVKGTLHDSDTGTNYSPMPEDRRSVHVGDHVNYETYVGYVDASGNKYGERFLNTSKYKSCGYETDTGCHVVEDTKGNKYYLVALQKFFWKGENQDKSYFGWSTNNREQCVDVITTDGYIIHFLVADANAAEHTNGAMGTGQSGDWEIEPLHYTQYKYMFSVIAGNSLEIWGKSSDCVSKFMKKYNFKDSGDGNHIAYVRMYNAKGSDAPDRINNYGKEQAYSLTGKAIVTDTTTSNSDPNGGGGSSDNPDNPDGSGAADKANQNANGTAIEDKYIPEDQLVGLEGQFDKLDKTAKDVELAKREDFSEDELTAIETVRKGQKAELIAKITYWVRVITVFMGLLIILYGGMMLLAYLFDRANNFFDISLLSMVTLGNLSASDGLEGKSKHELAPSRVIASSLIVIAAGCFIVSGAEFLFIHNIYSWIEGIVK